MAEATTTCRSCGRAVMVDHVDARGDCVLHQSGPPAPAQATEEEWADLGRPADSNNSPEEGETY